MTNYRIIATFTYPSDITIAKSTLKANEIDCYVRDELTIQVHNFLSNAIGGIRLEVPEEQYDNAIQILIESGFQNFIVENNLSDNDVEYNNKTKKILKTIIKIVFIICLLWISVAIYFLFLNG